MVCLHLDADAALAALAAFLVLNENIGGDPLLLVIDKKKWEEQVVLSGEMLCSLSVTLQVIFFFFAGYVVINFTANERLLLCTCVVLGLA